MSLDLLALIVFLTALVTAFTIIGRKIPRLVSLDVTTLPKERSAIMKDMLVARRLERKIRVQFQKLHTMLRPTYQRFGQHIHNLMQRVETKEREYQQQARVQSSATAETSLTQLQNLLASAALYTKEGEYAKAERQYIEIVGLAPGCAEAFEGLGTVYLQQKDYLHAKESLHHAIKLKPNDVALYLDLAHVHRSQGDRQKALAASRQACDVAPNDPRALDALLEDSIAVGDRQTAEEALANLTTTNPENQKLEEFRSAVAVLPAAASHHRPQRPKHSAPL